MTLQLLEPEVPSEAAIRKEQEALELVVAAKETLNQDQVWLGPFLQQKSVMPLYKFMLTLQTCKSLDTCFLTL